MGNMPIWSLFLRPERHNKSPEIKTAWLLAQMRLLPPMIGFTE